MAVTFTIEGGSECRFHDNEIPVQFRDGRTVLASNLANGDVFRIRSGADDLAWATIISDPVVS
jgi:hypothetical protein